MFGNVAALEGLHVTGQGRDTHAAHMHQACVFLTCREEGEGERVEDCEEHLCGGWEGGYGLGVQGFGSGGCGVRFGV